MLKTPADVKDRRFARLGGNKRRGEESDLRRASSRGLIPKAKIKTVKMTFVIVFVFILCWSPYIVFDLLQVYGHLPRTQTMIAVATFIQSLAPLNSAANPIIYISFSNNVCRNLRRLAVVQWLARRMPWCPCGADDRPLGTSTYRYGTDFTTMSESRSRSNHARSTVHRNGATPAYGAAPTGRFSEISINRGGATSAALVNKAPINDRVRV